MISYEFPLNERIRTLLRLEDLYERVGYFAAKNDPEEHHVALLSLFEILDVAGRADLKSDLMQELERQKHQLEFLRNNPSVSQEALTGVLSDIERSVSDLFLASGKTGQELRENDWLMSIKQRSAIPGGVCEFDLPSYHFWLNRDAHERRVDLHNWLAPFVPIRNGVRVILKLLRESGKTSQQVAQQGVYQQMLAGRLAQLIRVRLSRSYDCIPEISANKYALNVRFTEASGSQRRTSTEDVAFELTFCNL
ncbi:MAG TPA: cell division protein ZapD [Burkholderiales bacterium]|nr:cell division protein ZapD [Burkholderiales bacterium]